MVPRFQAMKFMPTQGSAHSIYDSTGDDHDGGPAAGVAYGEDPAAGEPCYQFGEIWVSASLDPQPMCGRVLLAFSFDSANRARQMNHDLHSKIVVTHGAPCDLIDYHACRTPKCPTGRLGREQRRSDPLRASRGSLMFSPLHWGSG
jgi:hypothetical protein